MATVLRLSIAEYDRMIAAGAFEHVYKRIELLDGVLTEMSPAGPTHDGLITYLTRWSIKNTDENVISVCVQTGLTLPEFDSRPEPDLCWVKAGRYMDRHPQASDVFLVIEIASSSRETDAREKLQLYAKSKIPEYWIVDVERKLLQVFRDPISDGYRILETVGLESMTSPLCQPDAKLQVRILFDKS